MAVRKFKPTSPGRRFMTVSDFQEITKSEPEKTLIAPLSKRAGRNVPGAEWHFARRIAIWLALPFAIGGWWSLYLGLLAAYAATSFFIIQHLRHGVERD